MRYTGTGVNHAHNDERQPDLASPETHSHAAKCLTAIFAGCSMGAGSVAGGVALGGPAAREWLARWPSWVVPAHRRDGGVCDVLEDRLFPGLFAPGLRPVQHELVDVG